MSLGMVFSCFSIKTCFLIGYQYNVAVEVMFLSIHTTICDGGPGGLIFSPHKPYKFWKVNFFLSGNLASKNNLVFFFKGELYLIYNIDVFCIYFDGSNLKIFFFKFIFI